MSRFDVYNLVFAGGDIVYYNPDGHVFFNGPIETHGKVCIVAREVIVRGCPLPMGRDLYKSITIYETGSGKPENYPPLWKYFPPFFLNLPKPVKMSREEIEALRK